MKLHFSALFCFNRHWHPENYHDVQCRRTDPCLGLLLRQPSTIDVITGIECYGLPVDGMRKMCLGNFEVMRQIEIIAQTMSKVKQCHLFAVVRL